MEGRVIRLIVGFPNTWIWHWWELSSLVFGTLASSRKKNWWSSLNYKTTHCRAKNYLNSELDFSEGLEVCVTLFRVLTGWIMLWNYVWKTTKMRLSADLNTWKRGLTILQFPEMQWADNPNVLHSIKTGDVLLVATYSYEGWRR